MQDEYIDHGICSFSLKVSKESSSTSFALCFDIFCLQYVNQYTVVTWLHINLTVRSFNNELILLIVQVLP